ncbi:HNH endonuclease [Rhodococcus phage Peregrin]|nr:HNH endonuclease [Rhodococcus phage Peregrin]
MEVEFWEDISNYEGLYQVSNLGRIKSLERVVNGRQGPMVVRERIMKPGRTRGGYLQVMLSKGGIRSPHKIHATVAKEFLGPRPSGFHVCHNDGNVKNNRISNLRYDTPRENRIDQIKHGTDNNANKAFCPRGHTLDAENLVPHILKLGRRQCQACFRSSPYCNRNPEYDISIVSDLCFKHSTTPHKLKKLGLI